MRINRDEKEAYEKAHMQLTYDMLGQLISYTVRHLVAYNNIRRECRIKEELPNIAITLNNKITQFHQIFKKAGISFWIQEVDSEEELCSNILGDAIFVDLLNQAESALTKMNVHRWEIIKILMRRKNELERKSEQLEKVKNGGVISKLIFLFKSIMDRSSLENTIINTEEEREKIKSYYDEYIEADYAIWSYNLRDNIVETLVNYISSDDFIKNNDSREDLIPKLLRLLNLWINPNLEKLGLGDLIPQLEKRLREIFQQQSWVLSPGGLREIQGNQANIGKNSGSSFNIREGKTISLEYNE